MKIASFNIWNSNQNHDIRMQMLRQKLYELQVDVIALQEVRDEALVQKLSTFCDLPFYAWKKYEDCQEGLAILSKYPISDVVTNRDATRNNHIMSVTLTVDDAKWRITNVHLDWEHAHNKEIGIVEAVEMSEKVNCPYSVMLGDFNAHPISSIHIFLSGQQSLQGKSTRWIDLAESFARRSGTSCEITMDFFNNPRWRDDFLMDIPERYDWILLKDVYSATTPPLRLIDFSVFGQEEIDGITISDHYGILCELGGGTV